MFPSIRTNFITLTVPSSCYRFITHCSSTRISDWRCLCGSLRLDLFCNSQQHPLKHWLYWWSEAVDHSRCSELLSLPEPGDLLAFFFMMLWSDPAGVRGRSCWAFHPHKIITTSCWVQLQLHQLKFSLFKLVGTLFLNSPGDKNTCMLNYAPRNLHIHNYLQPSGLNPFWDNFCSIFWHYYSFLVIKKLNLNNKYITVWTFITSVTGRRLKSESAQPGHYLHTN